LFDTPITNIGISRREMGKYFRTIYAFPEECIVREFIEDAPAKFLGYKVLDICIFSDLRQLWRIAECVRHEENVGLGAKFTLKKVLSV
jgi:hypothetical protein